MTAAPSAPERACPTPSESLPDVRDLVGLALSGGGIRSASFNLGVLQGLASRHVLWIFDYLSTVSGGGFVGAWWSAWLSREPRQELFPAPEELEARRRADTAVLLGATPAAPPAGRPDASRIAQRKDPVHFLRLFSNYLTPKTGALSPDMWRLVAFFVRNLLFTWAALLPLLCAAILVGQTYFLADKDAANEFLGLRPSADSTSHDAKPSSVTAAVRTDGTAEAELNAGPYTHRLHHLSRPFAWLAAAYVTLALLWLAHSSARFALSLGGITLLAILAGVRIWPLARNSSAASDAGFQLGILATVVGTVLFHLVQSFRERERAPGKGPPVQSMADEHRSRLTKQQGLLLKIGALALFLLLISGFGHDVMRYLFIDESGPTSRLLRRAGGWGGLVLAIGSAAYTAAKASPSTSATGPKTTRSLGRIAIAIAPPLTILVLALCSAQLTRELVRRTMASSSTSILILGNTVVWLALLEVVFAIFESYNDPTTPAPDGAFSWRRFLPDPLLRLLGHAPPGATRPWYLMFSPRGWARIAVAAGAASLFRFADMVKIASLWSTIRTFSETIVATLLATAILTAVGAVSFARRNWKIALGSARPVVLLWIASATAVLCLRTNGGIQDPKDPRAVLAALLWIAILLGAVVGLGWLADPNALSMHGFYKGRLTRAYLGASNTARNDEEITDAAPGDDLRLTSLWNHAEGGPYHLINTTLSLVGGSDLATSQRSAENFVMSRYHCGSPRAGYRCTAEYMGGMLSLGTAAAVSGAAVSPTMGSKTPSAALSLLLSLLNVRLGFWAPTPSGRRWNEPHARLWPFYLLREALANTGQIGTYCYLTDGGHFDNTGLYALVERGCRYIVVSDCGADPDLGFEDIGVAIRRCRIDFGAEIDLGIERFAARDPEGIGQTHFVRGSIVYQPDHLRMLGLPYDAASRLGIILWIKPAVTSQSAVDVKQYHRSHLEFPQQSTADQWYDESQFESYRRLGYESARSALDPPPGAGIDAMFAGPSPPPSFVVTAPPPP